MPAARHPADDPRRPWGSDAAAPPSWGLPADAPALGWSPQSQTPPASWGEPSQAAPSSWGGGQDGLSLVTDVVREALTEDPATGFFWIIGVIVAIVVAGKQDAITQRHWVVGP